MSAVLEKLLDQASSLTAKERSKLMDRLYQLEDDWVVEPLPMDQHQALQSELLLRIDGPFIAFDSNENWKAFDDHIQNRSREILQMSYG